MTESTMSFFLNLAGICGACVGLSKIFNRHDYAISDFKLDNTFIAFFFFDK